MQLRALTLAMATLTASTLFASLPAWAQTPAPVLRDVVLVGSNWDGTAEVFDPHTFKVLKRIDIVPDRAEREAGRRRRCEQAAQLEIATEQTVAAHDGGIGQARRAVDERGPAQVDQQR